MIRPIFIFLFLIAFSAQVLGAGVCDVRLNPTVLKDLYELKKSYLAEKDRAASLVLKGSFLEKSTQLASSLNISEQKLSDILNSFVPDVQKTSTEKTSEVKKEEKIEPLAFEIPKVVRDFVRENAILEKWYEIVKKNAIDFLTKFIETDFDFIVEWKKQTDDMYMLVLILALHEEFFEEMGLSRIEQMYVKRRIPKGDALNHIRLKEDMNGKTLLLHQVLHCSFLVHALVKLGADADITQQYPRQNSVQELFTARSTCPSVEKVRFLVRDLGFFVALGAEIGSVNNRNVLHYLAECNAHNPNDKIEIAKILLAARMELLTERTTSWLTPLDFEKLFGIASDKPFYDWLRKTYP